MTGCTPATTAKRFLGALHIAVQRHEQTFGVLETDINKRGGRQVKSDLSVVSKRDLCSCLLEQKRDLEDRRRLHIQHFVHPECVCKLLPSEFVPL